MFNLISNAIKFTLQGKVSVFIKKIRNFGIECKVKDTGIGIAQEDIPKMFNIYGKLEDSKEINHKGIGLGLYITK